MFDWIQLGRFPEETKQPQTITKPPSCFTVGRLFFSAFFLLQAYHPKSSSSVSSLRRTESQLFCVSFPCFWACWGPLFFCFCVSSGVSCRVQTWGPSTINMCLTMQNKKAHERFLLAPLASSDSAIHYLEIGMHWIMGIILYQCGWLRTFLTSLTSFGVFYVLHHDWNKLPTSRRRIHWQSPKRILTLCGSQLLFKWRTQTFHISASLS